MTQALRTVTTCSALLLLSAALAAGQIVPRATYVDDGSFELPPAGPTSPRDPAAIAVAPSGRLHIVDQNGQVTVFNPDGSPARSYGSGGLREPVGIAIDELARAYVLDKGLKQVNVYNGTGELLLIIGGSDRGVSRLNDPVALAIGPSGFVFVLDKGQPSIAVFSRDGAFVRQLGLGTLIGDPIGIAVGGDGRIFIADKDGGAQIFTLPPFPDVAWRGLGAPQALSLGPVEEAAAIAGRRVERVACTPKERTHARTNRSDPAFVDEYGDDGL